MPNVESQIRIQTHGEILPLLVRQVAVLGAGKVAARLALHLASSGIPVLLLDESAAAGQPLPAQRALQAQPGDAEALARITPGSIDEDLARLALCDWVLDATSGPVEKKMALLRRLLPYLRPTAVLSVQSLPVAVLGEGLGEWRRRFLGTHFHEPQRSRRLLEMVPTSMSDPALVAAFAAFADRTLGCTVVEARDTPGLIAGRVALEAFLTAARLLLEQALSVEEVDALTGAVLGRGLFEAADARGIEALALAAAHLPSPGGSDEIAVLLQQMISRGWLGTASGQGFYRAGERGREVLDLARMEYRSQIEPCWPLVEPAAPLLAVGLRQMLGDAESRAARFLWPFLGALWAAACERVGEAADNLAAVDRAMRAGFGWEMGPFELWDAVGVEASLKPLEALAQPVRRRAAELLAAGQSGWYAAEGRACFDPVLGNLAMIARTAGHRRVADYRRAHALVRQNAGASLVDLGDGVGCIELHSLKNAIGGEVLSLLLAVLAADGESVRRFRAFVVTGDRADFSVGANLLHLLLLARAGNWPEIDEFLRGFQQMTSAIKYCPRPVVVAPFGLTLGGGAEICLHAACCQPHAATAIGLVECRVGLIPAGGGTKELLQRLLASAARLLPTDLPERFAQSVEVQSALRRAFDVIAQAQVSGSAAGGRRLGLFRSSDRVTMNRSRLLEDAKLQAMVLAEVGYLPPTPVHIAASGAPALDLLQTQIAYQREAGQMSAYDAQVAGKLAGVLTGGRLAPGTLVNEQQLLDLEREAFLSLIAEQKTQTRIAYTLKTGKPLRN